MIKPDAPSERKPSEAWVDCVGGFLLNLGLHQEVWVKVDRYDQYGEPISWKWRFDLFDGTDFTSKESAKLAAEDWLLALAGEIQENIGVKK